MSSKTILTARDAYRNDARVELGVTASTKVGFAEFVSFIELAPVIGEDDTFVWVCRDEAADIVDYIDADEAARAIAEGYTAREG